jgi:CDP-glycerol glycerophosphotransferase
MRTDRGPLRWVYDLLSKPSAASISDAWLSLKFNLAALLPPIYTGPRIALVIPVFNVERYILVCLRSVAAQRYLNLQVILVNDGSQDQSMELAKRFSQRLDLTIVNQANAGLAVARNAGAAAADNPDYIMFLDSDDALATGAFRKLVFTLEKTGSDFAVGDCVRTKGLTRVARVDTRLVYRGGTNNSTDFASSPEVIRDVTAWNKMFRWSFFQKAKISFPVGVYFEDMAEMTRAYIEAEKFDIISKVVYLWRVRTEGTKSITQNSSADKQFVDRYAALVEMRKLIDKAVKSGKASEKNLEAFAKRIKSHDLRLHADRTEQLEKLATY